MGLDRETTISKAERLLQAGKVAGALADLRSLAAAAPSDLALANRIGDLLVRHRRPKDALEYYDRAADQFARGGLYPKAIALGKKMLRLDPDRVETLSRIGAWYLAQRLPGEARSYLLHAADQFLAAERFDRAREVYERLVEAEPNEIRHRARLAESLAAEGRGEEAGEHLLALAASLTDGAGMESRESVYRRAMELLPDRDEPVLGLVRVLAGTGREGDAIDCLEARARGGAPSDRVRAELAMLYERAGREEEALATLARADGGNLPGDVVESILRSRIERGDAGGFWAEVGPTLVPREDAPASAAALVRLLERLAALEADGHVPALERLADWHERTSSAAANGVLERLHHALESAGRSDEADVVFERLVALEDREGTADAAVATAVAEDGGHGLAEVAVDRADVPIAAEAPGVPLNRTDEEFVAGRLTQAEILEKYGLREKALEQVREVVTRFPGHVDAQRRLVRLLEEGGTAADLRDALVALALALRADGSADEARVAASRAAASAPLDEETAGILAGLGLRAAEAEAGTASEATGDGAEVPEGRAPAEPAAAPVALSGDDDEVVFDVVLDDGDGGLDAAGDFGPTAPEAARADDGAGDDLAELARALDTELFDQPDEPILPEAAAEESLEDVFAAFRKRVEEEVGDDDPRTRYDLAVGYKEMGMLDEAVAEFEVAAASPALRFEASVMIAVIRREQGAVAEAVAWYRRALEVCEEAGDVGTDVRYDLAEVLEEAGDADEALQIFRAVSEADPGYRDVGERIHEIETRARG